MLSLYLATWVNFSKSTRMETLLKKGPELFSPDKIYSPEEYLLLEDGAAGKHEFRNGKVTPTPGAKPAHNTIAANVIAELKIALRKKEKRYIVMTGDTKIHVPGFNNIVYPDAVVVCERIELYPGSSTVITSPLLIVEVLSPSTETHDRQGKFNDYKQFLLSGNIYWWRKKSHTFNRVLKRHKIVGKTLQPKARTLPFI